MKDHMSGMLAFILDDMDFEQQDKVHYGISEP